MSIVNSLLKVFLGDKSGKDLKKLTPLVDEINKHFIGMSSLSNDELRGKTYNFKKIISDKTFELVSIRFAIILNSFFIYFSIRGI